VCASCSELKDRLRNEIDQLVESLEKNGSNFRPRRNYRLGNAPNDWAVLSGLGRPSALPNFGLTFPRHCINCFATEDLKPLEMKQTETAPVFLSGYFRDASLTGDFKITISVCGKCEELLMRAFVLRPSDAGLIALDGEKIKQRRHDQSPVFRWGVRYSHFHPLPEFHVIEFVFESSKYCQLFRLANSTKFLNKMIEMKLEGVDGWMRAS
jgi:hypothetical protein